MLICRLLSVLGAYLDWTLTLLPVVTTWSLGEPNSSCHHWADNLERGSR
jgi:hypothetical protein